MEDSVGSTARTGLATIWRDDQRLRCAIGFGVQNTTFCTAGSARTRTHRPRITAAVCAFSLASCITQCDGRQSGDAPSSRTLLRPGCLFLTADPAAPIRGPACGVPEPVQSI